MNRTGYIVQKLGAGAYTFTCGPITASVKIQSRQGQQQFAALYQDYPEAGAEDIADFFLAARPTSWLRYLVKRDVFPYTGFQLVPFAPLPVELTQVMVEMGLNWQTAVSIHQFLILHAGVVERDGIGIIMPGLSGSGKSTLSAALGFSGWRLLSDEFGMLEPFSGRLHACPRPISLKNRSADILREFAPENRFSPAFEGTPKGTITYLRPALDSIERMGESAAPRMILFPAFDPAAQPEIQKVTQIEAFAWLKNSTVNNDRLGLPAFNALSHLVDNCAIYRLHYKSLAEAMELIDTLTGDL